jgi:hypothetical protein
MPPWSALYSGVLLIQKAPCNYRAAYDVEHFLLIKQPALATQAASDQITIVFNWFEELRRRAPLKQ